MKAAVYERYGSAEVVTIAEAPRPAAGKEAILVKVAAASVSTADWRMRASAFPGGLWLPGRLMTGLFAPRHRILGTDFAGTVAETGPGVTRWKAGDAVFGFSGHGGHAEYLAMPQDGPMAAIPPGTGFEEAAAMPFGALSALVFLRDFARLRAGQRVLVLGASGGVGAFAVQIARHLGAEVTGVASGANLDLLRDLGAAQVIDYTREDFAAADWRWDAILDTVGATRFARARTALTPEGVYIPLEFGLKEAGQALVSAIRGGQRMRLGVSGDTRADLEILAGLLERGEVRGVIDEIFPLAAIAEAYRRVESRHKRGAVILAIDPEAIAGRAQAPAMAAPKLAFGADAH